MLLLSVALAAAPRPLPLLGGAVGPTPVREDAPVELVLDPDTAGCTLTWDALLTPSGVTSDRSEQLTVEAADGRIAVTLAADADLVPGVYRLLWSAARGDGKGDGASTTSGLEACDGVFEHSIVVPGADVQVLEPSVRIKRIAPFALGRFAGLLPDAVDEWLYTVQCPADEYPQCTDNRVFVPIVERGGQRGVSHWTATASVERWGSGTNADLPVPAPAFRSAEPGHPAFTLACKPTDEAMEPVCVPPEPADDSEEPDIRAGDFVLAPGASARVAVEVPDATPLGESELAVDLRAPALPAPIRIPVILEVRRTYWLLIFATLVGAFLQLFNKLTLPSFRESHQLVRHVAAVRRFLRGQRSRQDATLHEHLTTASNGLPSVVDCLNPFRWTRAVDAAVEVDLTLRPRLSEWNALRERLRADLVRVEGAVESVGGLRVQPPVEPSEGTLERARRLLVADDLPGAGTALAEVQRSVRAVEDQLQREGAMLATVLDGFVTGRLPLRRENEASIRAAVGRAASALRELVAQRQLGGVLPLLAPAHSHVGRALDRVQHDLSVALEELGRDFGPSVAAGPTPPVHEAGATISLADATAWAQGLERWAVALRQWSRAGVGVGAAAPQWAEGSAPRRVSTGEYWGATGASAGLEGVEIGLESPVYSGPVGSPLVLTEPIPVEQLPAPPVFPNRNLLLAIAETSMGVTLLCFVAYLTYADKFVGTASECFVVVAFAYAANLGIDSLLAPRNGTVPAGPTGGKAPDGADGGKALDGADGGPPPKR